MQDRTDPSGLVWDPSLLTDPEPLSDPGPNFRRSCGVLRRSAVSMSSHDYDVAFVTVLAGARRFI